MDQLPPQSRGPRPSAVTRSGDDPAHTEEALADLRDFEELVARNWPHLPPLLDPLHKLAAPRSVVDTPFEIESGQIHIGRYSILRILGEGGGGVVALASDTVLGRRVALKVPGTKALVSASARKRFITEARAAARLRHPNVVTIHDAEDAGAFCYFVMDYWPGGSLAEWLASRPVGHVVPPRQAASLTIGIALGVQHAHDQGILHRDLKPGNILLAQEEDGFDSLGFRPMVADFGLAKILDEPPDSNPTLTGEPLGTLAYMAPEQVRGDLGAISPATDVYGLGAILYELLTRCRPHAGLTRAERLERGRDQRVEPPRRAQKLIPVDLETICLKCLEPEPADRYQAASEVANELRRYLGGLPILARRPSLREQTTRWCRRRRVAATLIALAPFLILAALGAFVALNAWTRGLHVELLKERDHAAQLAYDSQVRLASSAYQEDQLGRAQRILRDVMPASGQPDRREFAWRYLWNESRRRAILLDELPEGSQAAASTASLKLLIVSSQQGDVTAFDRASVQRLWTAPPTQPGSARALALSPDDQLLAVGCVARNKQNASKKNSFVELRDAHTGKSLGSPVSLPGRVVEKVAFIDNGKTVAVLDHPPGSNASSHVSIWSIETGSDPAKPALKPLRHFDDLGPAAFSPTAASFASTRSGSPLRLFDTLTGNSLQALTQAPASLERPPVFSPDGQRLAVYDDATGRLLVWQSTTGVLTVSLGGFTSTIERLALQPGGQSLVVTGTDGSTLLLDPPNDRRIVLFPAPSDPVNENTQRVSFTPDGRGVLLNRSAYQEPNLVELRSADDGSRLAAAPVRHRGYIEAWQVLESGNGQPPCLLYSIGPSLWLWPYEGRAQRATTTPIGHNDETWAVAFSPNGRLLATASNDSTETQTIRLWDTYSRSLLQGWKAHTATVTSLAFHPDGKTLASCSLDDQRQVALWDVPSGALLKSLDAPCQGARAVAFSPDGKTLAAAGSNGAVQLWETTAYRPLLTIAAHDDRVHDLAFSPDGQLLATASDDGRVRVWNKNGRLQKTYETHEAVFALAFDPVGKTLAAADHAGTITVINPAWRSPVLTIRSDEAEIRALAYSPDGKTLAAAGLAGVIKLWDPVTGQELLSLEGHRSQINGLEFRPDGKELASADHAGAVYLWACDQPRAAAP